MKALKVRHQHLALGGAAERPRIDLVFAACRAGPDEHISDIVNVGEGIIDRWSMPRYTTRNLIAMIEAEVDARRCPVSVPFLVKETQSIHVTQLSRNGHLLMSRGNFYYGGSFYFIDTNTGEGFAMEDDAREPMLYTATGAFSPDHSQWTFVRWPARQSIEIINGKRKAAECEIVALDLAKRTLRLLHTLATPDHIHQVTYSLDGRYLVFTSFKADLRVPYPHVPIAEAAPDYRRSHEAGITCQPVITLDIATGRHWTTELPRPVSAHMEFDPIDPTAFYVSAHNFSVNCEPAVILEGPGGIFKLRLGAEGARLESGYAPGDLFRVSQHVPFVYEGHTLLAVTNTPNKLDLVDARTMTLWRRETLFPWNDLDFSRTGSAVSPAPPKAFFSLNPSTDGRHIVLESSESFHIYATDEARFLDIAIPRQIPAGCSGSGHTRIAGR